MTRDGDKEKKMGKNERGAVQCVQGKRCGRGTLHVFESSTDRWKIPINAWVQVGLAGDYGGRRALCYTVAKGHRGAAVPPKTDAAGNVLQNAWYSPDVACEVDEMLGEYLVGSGSETARALAQTTKRGFSGMGQTLRIVATPLGKVGWVESIDVVLTDEHPQAVRMAQLSLSLWLKGKCVHAGEGEVLVDFFGQSTLVFETRNAVVQSTEPDYATVVEPTIVRRLSRRTSRSSGVSGVSHSESATPTEGTLPVDPDAENKPAKNRLYGVITPTTHITFVHEKAPPARSPAAVATPHDDASNDGVVDEASEADGITFPCASLHRPTPCDQATKALVQTALVLRAEIPGIVTENANELSRFLIEGFFPNSQRNRRTRTRGSLASPLTPGSPLRSTKSMRVPDGDAMKMSSKKASFFDNADPNVPQKVAIKEADSVHDLEGECPYSPTIITKASFSAKKGDMSDVQVSNMLLEELGFDPDDRMALFNPVTNTYTPPAHLLVQGPPGAGKTFLAEALQKFVKEKWDIPSEVVHVSELFREKLAYGGVGAAGVAVRTLFTKAKEIPRGKHDPFRKNLQAPANHDDEQGIARKLIIIEGIEGLVADGEEMTRVALSQFARELELITETNAQANGGRRILCIAPCRSWEAVHPLLRGLPRFFSFLTLGVLSARQRERILIHYGVHAYRAETLALAYPSAIPGDLKRLACGDRPADGFEKDPVRRADAVRRFITEEKGRIVGDEDIKALARVSRSGSPARDYQLARRPRAAALEGSSARRARPTPASPASPIYPARGSSRQQPAPRQPEAEAEAEPEVVANDEDEVVAQAASEEEEEGLSVDEEEKEEDRHRDPAHGVSPHATATTETHASAYPFDVTPIDLPMTSYRETPLEAVPSISITPPKADGGAPMWMRQHFHHLVAVDDTVQLLWNTIISPLATATAARQKPRSRRSRLSTGAGDSDSDSGGDSGARGSAGVSGILFHGASGTGKTAMADALVQLLTNNAAHGLPRFSKFECTATSIISKVVGESEAAIRNLFASARANAPSVVVIDQLEALAYRRGSETVSKALDRTLSTLLTELDGVHGKGAACSPVLVLAATSQQDVIDPAILRSGRLDLHVATPSYSAEAGAGLLYNLLAASAADPPVLHAAITQLVPEADFATFADVVRAADVVKMCALREAVEVGGITEPKVTNTHLAQGLADSA
eukprot:TRINITY_DN1887_c0_g1_i1.p1 TRINITY_DN1887_c0_g1~~TRINITY_DN1887_c0_g1_i1.p1  ORF type:complete len:1199 (+),score=323.57 TRINITY_DN1887_c0_g1_i1:116-3712(+)